LVYNPLNNRTRRNLEYLDADEETINSDMFSDERMEAIAEMIYGYSITRHSNAVYNDLYDYINKVI
jgi:hypothetical protein